MPGKKPLGDRLREIFEAARNYERRSEIQLRALDIQFKILAKQCSEILEKGLAEFDKVDKEKKNIWVLVSSLTGSFNPKFALPVPINTTLTDYTAEQVCALPNYIHLHEIARDFDIDLQLVGVVKEEDGVFVQCLLIVDTSKGYEEEKDSLYPKLPPRPPSLDRRSGSCDLKS